jgi:hypothetical protein
MSPWPYPLALPLGPNRLVQEKRYVPLARSRVGLRPGASTGIMGRRFIQGWPCCKEAVCPHARPTPP